MARIVVVGSSVGLGIKFYSNGSLFDPFYVGAVKVYDAAVGGNVLDTLVPSHISTGYYQITYNAPTDLTAGTYYDEWTWRAEEFMDVKVQRYSFAVTEAPITPGQDEDEEYVESVQVICRDKPIWPWRTGLEQTEDLGNGMGVSLVWREAIPADSDNTVHYNIYYDTKRVNVFDIDSWPKAITLQTYGAVNVDPGDLHFFGVRATEFDTSAFNIEELSQIGPGVYAYPDEQTLLADIDAYGATLQVADTSTYPSKGYLQVDYEVLYYTSKTDTTFMVILANRGIYSTTPVAHLSGAAVKLFKGIQEGNTVIVAGTAAWTKENGPPRNTDAIGQVNVDADGYRTNATDIINPDYSASDANTEDFPNFDYCGYHRPSMQTYFKGGCQNSYAWGELNGYRGVGLQDQNLARLDMMLQTTGEPVILLKRKHTGKRCRCIGLRNEHQQKRCHYCFAPGTLVRSENGYKPIEEIREGEKVLSSDGQFHRVSKVIKTQFDGKFVSLKPSVSTNEILVTPEHPILAMGGSHSYELNTRCCGPKCDVFINNGDGDCFTDDVHQLPSGKWQARFSSNRNRISLGTFDSKEEAILMVRNHKALNIPKGHVLEWVDAKDLQDSCWTVSRWPSMIKDIDVIKIPDRFLKTTKLGMKRNGVEQFVVDEEFMWIVGLYLAEGSCGTRAIQFSLHEKEVLFQNRVKTFFENLGYGVKLSHYADNGTNVIINSTTLAEWFPEWLGRGCQNKRIPEELMSLPNNKTKAIIQGVYDGDGTKSCNEIGQTSEILALQLSELLHRIGEQPLIRRQINRIKTPAGNDRKTCYIVNWAEEGIKNSNRKGRWIFKEDILTKTVKRDSDVYYSGPVYNLEVEGDHTYIVNGIVVHNCLGTGFEGGFDRYVNPRAISEFYTNTQGMILIRVNPYDDDIKMAADNGIMQTTEITAWTINIPTILVRDCVIRFNEDGTEEFRYECVSVNRNRLMFGQTGSQIMKIKRLDKTSIEYSFDWQV